TSGHFLSDVDVWKTTVTYHHAAHAVVPTLKELNVRGEILRNQVVVRETNDRHLFVRIDLAGADPGKVFQTSQEAGALQSAHVNRRVSEDFARRAPERSRVETVRQQVAVFGHDGHHGREVHVESQHAQDFAGDSAESARRGKIAVLPNRAGGGHRCEDAAQPIDKAALLIDAK